MTETKDGKTKGPDRAMLERVNAVAAQLKRLGVAMPGYSLAHPFGNNRPVPPLMRANRAARLADRRR